MTIARVTLVRPRSFVPVAWIAMAGVAGCFAHERDAPSLDLCDRPQSELHGSFASPQTHGVDIVLLVDGTAVMHGLDEDARGELRIALDAVADGDADGDGTRETLPERSVRVAVIDMDMGALDTASCPPGDGDAAGTRTMSPGCGRALASADADGVLTFTRGGPVTSEQFVDEVVCAMNVGTSGCSYARGMDALVAALDPARGLLRDDSQVFLLVVTSQDDCSTSNPSVFASGSAPALRCHDGAALLRPIDDVADAILARLPHPAWTTLSILGGMPGSPSQATTTALLADPQMTEHVEPSSPDRLASVCDATVGSATPSRRWVALAQRLREGDVSTTLRSICSPAWDALDAWFGNPDHLQRCAWVAAPLARDAAGRARCDVTLTLPPIGSGALAEHCSELAFAPAYTLDRVVTTTAADGTLQQAEVCRIRRASDRTVPGWSEDGGAECPGGGLALPRLGIREGRLDVSCDSYPLPTTRTAVMRGAACDATTDALDGDDAAHCRDGRAIDHDETTPALACDGFTRTCQVPCVADADCQILGPSLACDLRSPSAYFGAHPPTGLPATRGFCFDVMCDPSVR